MVSEEYTEDLDALYDELYADAGESFGGEVDNEAVEEASLIPKVNRKKKVSTKGKSTFNDDCDAYIRRFAKVAQAEQAKYGIPASITLAQGIIESRAGTSKMAKDINNHFGMKCMKRGCRHKKCGRYTDDAPDEPFIRFDNAWQSFRAHSLLLMNSRYQRHCKGKGYVEYAKGLKKGGYATDKKYAYKLISIIKTKKLYRYDK